ncbi:MAG TPA: outer membrane protein assembly factor BamB [Methylophilaceae bacterium]|nr:outer membrane protein assembly factor BamB [Methylophilaceae bacterium]
MKFKLSWLLPLLCAIGLLGGCTSLTDLKTDISERMFGREPTDPPTPLKEFKPRAQSKVIWSAKVGEAGDFTFTPAVENGQVYAASAGGEVFRFDAISGKQVWRVAAGESLSGGVGVGESLVLVGTPSGYVIAHNLEGKLLWKSKVSSEVLSVPQVSSGIVVVRAGDGRVFGLSAADGSRKWIYQRATPALSLRSSAGVAVDSGFVYVGFAGGKLIALRLDDGKIVWEASVAQPRVVTEIERIADITSLPVVDGPLVYAVAYQGKIAAVDRATGRVLWSRDISSYTGINAEESRIYVAHANSSIYALDYSSGKTFWKQDDLMHRNSTAPLPMGGVIAVGDLEGYVHFLDREDGSFYSRVRTMESPIMARMTALGTNGMLAQTRDGGLYAISIK